MSPFEDEMDPRYDSPLGHAIRALLEILELVEEKAPRNQIVNAATAGLAEAMGEVA